jgi:hypothetical protein
VDIQNVDKIMQEIPSIVTETNAQLLVDEFISKLNHKLDIYKWTKDDIVFWAVYADLHIVKQRLWGWYGWLDFKDKPTIAVAIDVPIRFLKIDYTEFIEQKDPITIALNQRMLLEFKEKE